MEHGSTEAPPAVGAQQRCSPLVPTPAAQESLYSDIDRRSAYYRATRRAEQVATHPPPQPLLTPPNILTLLRVLLVPVFVVTWYSTGKCWSTRWQCQQSVGSRTHL